ncbi:MAG: WYL domain-containing protein [Candidatus Cryptobacteroides sp.]
MTFSELEKLYNDTGHEAFRSFITEIKRLRTSGETTDFQLANDLGKIVENELEECREIGCKGTGMDALERQRLFKAANLTACCILLLCETRSRTEIRNKTMLLLEYLSYLQSGSHDLFGAAVRVCSYSMTNPGFSWSLLETPNNIDILAYNLSENARFDKEDRLPALAVDSAGSVKIEDGVLSVSSAPSRESCVKSYSDHGGLLEVCTRQAKDEKLKASETDEAGPLENFARIFLLSQSQAARKGQAGKFRKLEKGKKYTVRLAPSEDEETPHLDCAPLDVESEALCHIQSEELVMGLYTRNLIEYIYDDDCIEGAVLLDDSAAGPVFSIKEAYVNYARAVAQKDMRDRRVYQARVVGFFKGKTEDKDRVILLSDKGYGGLFINDRSLEMGQVATMYTQNINGPDAALFINMARPSFSYPETPGQFNGEEVLADFVKDKKEALQNLRNARKEDKDAGIFKDIVRQIALILFSSAEKRSVVRYRDLLCSAFLFNIAGDESRRDLARGRADYLNQCLRLAEGLEVRPLDDNAALSEKEKRVVRMLSGLGSTRDICQAASLIQGMDDPAGQELARLFMAHTLSCINQDELSVSRESLRRKICELLGVVDHFRGDILKGGGKYGKGELENVEFKSSYVFYNKDGKPDLFKQGRGQVLEAVCGFMNKDGGTVYVGVNDAGDPLVSETYGLNADIAWFRSNFHTVNMLRRNLLGHNVPQPENLDSYCRFLNSELELYFKPTVRGCVSISPTEDMDAIRITVKPSEYEIAKLYTDNSWNEGCVYVRDGEETRPMTRHDQEQRLMKLRRVGKVEQFILILTEAIDTKRKVTLKEYASSNSNTVSDRFVVPINLVYNNENLWAYDIEKRKCRVFRLARIGSIEVEDSTYSHAFEKGEADVFRWVNPEENYHIKLRMDISAVNNLLEEYSNARNLPREELYQESPEKWILDTQLHGLDAVRRFYLGLADKIEIMETEDSETLKSHIKEYLETELQMWRSVSGGETVASQKDCDK